MSIDIVLPDLGEPTAQATVSRWLKSIGDSVTEGDPLLEVSTDKVDTEIPAPATGVLIKLRANEDDLVKVGEVMGVISTPDVIISVPAATQPAPPAVNVPEVSPPAPTTSDNDDTRVLPVGIPMFATPPTPPPQPKPPELTYATPGLRQLADLLDVDLTSVQGSGVGGRIRRQDVVAASDAQSAGPDWRSGLPADDLEHMTTSWTAVTGDAIWLTVSYDDEAATHAVAILDDLTRRLAR